MSRINKHRHPRMEFDSSKVDIPKSAFKALLQDVSIDDGAYELASRRLEQSFRQWMMFRNGTEGGGNPAMAEVLDVIRKQSELLLLLTVSEAEKGA